MNRKYVEDMCIKILLFQFRTEYLLRWTKTYSKSEMHLMQNSYLLFVALSWIRLDDRTQKRVRWTISFTEKPALNWWIKRLRWTRQRKFRFNASPIKYSLGLRIHIITKRKERLGTRSLWVSETSERKKDWKNVCLQNNE